jgi:hypothetical protein
MTRTALLTGAGALALGLLFLSQLSASTSAVPVQRETMLASVGGFGTIQGQTLDSRPGGARSEAVLE